MCTSQILALLSAKVRFTAKSKNREEYRNFLLLLLWLPSFCFSEQPTHSTSTVTVPISIDLKVLENRLNKQFSDTLFLINESNKVLYSKKLLTISGDVTGWVKRNGNIIVTGQNNSLVFAIPITTQISVSAMKVSGTVNAAAIVYISITPHLHHDWSVTSEISMTFSWIQKPELLLLHKIPITFTRIIEPKLRKFLDKKSHDFSESVAEFDVKARMTEKWHALQLPIEISANPAAYLSFTPTGVSYSGITINNTSIETVFSMQGITRIDLGKQTTNINFSPLVDLNAIPYQDGIFQLDLPIYATFSELTTILASKIATSNRIQINDNTESILLISNPEITSNKNGKLLISVLIETDPKPKWLQFVDIFNWFDFYTTGRIAFQSEPVINQANRTLFLKNIEYESSTNSKLLDSLVDFAGIEILSNYLESRLRYDFGKKLDTAVVRANKSISEKRRDDMILLANLENASIANISIQQEYIRIDTRLSGTIQAVLGEK